MGRFVNTFNLFDRDIGIREILLEDYIIVLKSLLGNVPEPKALFTNFIELLKEYTTLDEKEIEELDFLEFLMLVCTLRTTSLGNVVKLSVEIKDSQEAQLNLNIDKILEFLGNARTKAFELLQDNSSIRYRLPTVKELFYYVDDTEDELDVLMFVDSIDGVFSKLNVEKNLLLEERKKITNRLPAVISTKIFKMVHKCLVYFEDLNLMSIVNSGDVNKKYSLPIKLNLYSGAILLKLLFSDDLLSLYRSIYDVSKTVNIDVYKCAIGEFLIYIKFLEADIKDSRSPRPENADFDDSFDGMAISNSDFTP